MMRLSLADGIAYSNGPEGCAGRERGASSSFGLMEESMQIGKLGPVARLLAAVSALVDGESRAGAVGHARERQAEGQARRRRQGRLQAVRLHRSVGQDRRPRDRPRAGRREAPRRAGRARSGRRREPDGVPEAGTHRPHDRDDGLQARPRRGGRHSGAVLLRRGRQRLRARRTRGSRTGRISRASRSARSRARTTTAAPARSSARSSSCSRA